MAAPVAAPVAASGATPREERVRAALSGRPLVLVGLMGAGKSTVGRRLAMRLGLPFRDADTEIEEAAGMSIPDIFEIYGEAHFRDGERRVIDRLLREGRIVLATGGGAFMDDATRRAVAASGVSVWLKADLDTLMRRVRKRSTRPLLQNADPEGTMRALMERRYPVYATADVVVESHDGAHEEVVEAVVAALEAHLATETGDAP
ncbi:shikimate kinase [Salinarimonas rosea]|uniref:shikimate kinase n=1 Tax=Salinarimonas rosea TaxID=552063 RepID=UPI001FDA922A|nr:shikimate kinase [Salinarimonas rosea]